MTRTTRTKCPARTSAPAAPIAPVDPATVQLLTVPEVARLLGIHSMTAWKAVWRNEIPSILVGKRSRRIPVASLQEYIAQRQAEAEGGVA